MICRNEGVLGYEQHTDHKKLPIDPKNKCKQGLTRFYFSINLRRGSLHCIFRCLQNLAPLATLLAASPYGEFKLPKLPKVSHLIQVLHCTEVDSLPSSILSAKGQQLSNAPSEEPVLYWHFFKTDCSVYSWSRSTLCHGLNWYNNVTYSTMFYSSYANVQLGLLPSENHLSLTKELGESGFLEQ